MTIREIADLTGRSRRTIQDWLNKTTPGEICQGILAKTARAEKESRAAEFTLDETISILENKRIDLGFKSEVISDSEV